MEPWVQDEVEYGESYGQSWHEFTPPLHLPFQAYAINWDAGSEDLSDDSNGTHQHSESHSISTLDLYNSEFSPRKKATAKHHILKKHPVKKVQTPRTRKLLLEKHRESERVRHQTLNKVMTHICGRIPTYLGNPRETKAHMMQRIVKYIVYLEYAISDLCQELGVNLTSTKRFLTSRLASKIDHPINGSLMSMVNQFSTSPDLDCNSLLGIFRPNTIHTPCASVSPSPKRKAPKRKVTRVTSTACVTPEAKVPSPCCWYELQSTPEPPHTSASPQETDDVWVPPYMYETWNSGTHRVWKTGKSGVMACTPDTHPVSPHVTPPDTYPVSPCVTPPDTHLVSPRITSSNDASSYIFPSFPEYVDEQFQNTQDSGIMDSCGDASQDLYQETMTTEATVVDHVALLDTDPHSTPNISATALPESYNAPPQLIIAPLQATIAPLHAVSTPITHTMHSLPAHHRLPAFGIIYAVTPNASSRQPQNISIVNIVHAVRPSALPAFNRSNRAPTPYNYPPSVQAEHHARTIHQLALNKPRTAAVNVDTEYIGDIHSRQRQTTPKYDCHIRKPGPTSVHPGVCLHEAAIIQKKPRKKYTCRQKAGSDSVKSQSATNQGNNNIKTMLTKKGQKSTSSEGTQGNVGNVEPEVQREVVNRGVATSQISQMMGERWRGMTEDERLPYRKKAQKLCERMCDASKGEQSETEAMTAESCQTTETVVTVRSDPGTLLLTSPDI